MRFVPVPGCSVLFCIWDTRVQDYREFVHDTGTRWIRTDFDQSPTHPAVNISWAEAKQFCRWLTEKEQKTRTIGAAQEYRLPTDAEWSLAAGLAAESGRTPSEKSSQARSDFPWGKEWPPTRLVGNYCDERFFKKYVDLYHLNSSSTIHGYDDGFPDTSPVDSFPPNARGIHDMGGNVWQWCEDWYDDAQHERVLRGASFTAVDPTRIRLSFRYHLPPDTRYANYGFRCVLTTPTGGDDARSQPRRP